MFTLKPKAHIDDLFQRGTDIPATGRFHQTLAFNHFQQKDAQHLHDIYEKLQNVSPTTTEIFRQLKHFMEMARLQYVFRSRNALTNRRLFPPRLSSREMVRIATRMSSFTSMRKRRWNNLMQAIKKKPNIIYAKSKSLPNVCCITSQT